MATQSAIIKIDLQLEGGQKLALSVGNLKQLKDAIKQINDTKITLDPRSPNFVTASNQLKTLQGLYKGLAKDADSAEIQIQQANAALNEPPKAIGYYRQLQAQLVTLKNQFKDLSETEAKGKLGQNLAGQINGISNQLKAQDALLGDFQRNVGNYKQAITGIGSVLAPNIVAGGGIVAGVSLVKEAMTAGIGQAIAYEKALDNLSALTGLEGAALDNLDQLARSLQNIDVEGGKIVNTGPEILNALKLVGGARPELLGDAEALSDVAKQAIVLSKASGDELAPSVLAITTTLGQFKLAGQDSGRVINELAAGAKEGAAEIPDITSALKEFGTVAEIGNVSTSESIALIETLADRQLKGAEAGTQLRNVLSKLASADILPRTAQDQFKKLGIDINVLKDASLPLETRLRELGKAQGDVSALTKIFGLENLQAATIITSGLDKYTQLNEKIQGTSEAYRQAGINADNTATKFENLQKGALNKLEETFNVTGSSGGFLIDTLDFLIQKLDLFEVSLNLAIGPAKQLFDEISNFSSLEVPGILDPLGLLGGGKKGLQGLDVNSLKQTIDLTTGALIEPQASTAPIQDNTAVIDKNTEATDKNTESKKKNKEEDLGAADSIARLTKQVQAAQDALSKSAQSGIGKATANLVLAEQALNRAKALEAEARNPTPNLSELDQANAGLVSLGVSIDNPTNEADAQAQLDALALSLAGSVGVVMPVEIDQEQARRDFEIQRYFNDKESEANKKNAEEKADLAKKQLELEKGLLQEGLNAASNFNSQLAANDLARIDKQLQATNTAITEEFDKKREAAQGNTQVIENLDKQQKAKQLAAEKQAARERRNIAIKEATIAFFLGLIKAAGNPAQIIAVSAAYALGLVSIKAQEFWAGGTVKDGIGNQEGVVKSPNMRPTRRGDNRVAYLKVGERVLTRDNQAAIEQQYGSQVWKSIGAKDPGSIFGAKHVGAMPLTFGSGRQILNVNTTLSKQDIGALAKANSISSKEMGQIIREAMAEGAKYSQREAKALAKAK